MELQNRSARPPPSGDRRSTEGFFGDVDVSAFPGHPFDAPECPKEAPRADLEWCQACPEVTNLARFWLSKIILQQHQVVGRWSGDAPKRGSASFRDQQSVQVVGRPKQCISEAFMLERYCKRLKLSIQKTDPSYDCVTAESASSILVFTLLAIAGDTEVNHG